jgi:hypothetical protein
MNRNGYVDVRGSFEMGTSTKEIKFIHEDKSVQEELAHNVISLPTENK